MSTDRTFITNENGQTLKGRFEDLIKGTRLFDCLAGYFYTSGFFSIYPALEGTEKIRVLVGVATDRDTSGLIWQANHPRQQQLQFSHAETKEGFADQVIREFEEAPDQREVEDGVNRFIEWIRSGKLQIRVYPSERIHAKVYIMTFPEGHYDKGRVITGSSNFTRAGLIDNLEFNVELKNASDYEFALQKFNELWQDGVDVSGKYVETIHSRTWLNQTISPYELYLKFLYEYFKDELNMEDEVFADYLPEGFKKLEYQEQAVLNARKILEEYGGVFISDVVGLGKTYIASMLAKQLEGRTLILAPPVLTGINNPGSWANVRSDFVLRADCESIGKLDEILERGVEKYKNIIIDEAHRFRTETNVTYEKLAEICRGKRVILVTATPYNNTPADLLSQIKLFQNSRKSAIPNLPDLESFFFNLGKRLKGLDRQRDHDEYLRITKENAKIIREKVLKYLMVRRTRSEIIKYFPRDLKEQKLKFPEVEAPVPLFYELDEHEDNIFNRTVELITRRFKYARYIPLLYYKGDIDELEKQSQRNLQGFMKVLLIKRLESSFYAFTNTIGRFIHSYELFTAEVERGNVYFSKKHLNKIFEILENGDDDAAIERLIAEGKAERLDTSEFREDFRADLINDLRILKEIKGLWETLDRDPKLRAFVKVLKEHPVLAGQKLIVFTESRETAEYLSKRLAKQVKGGVLCFHGSSGEEARDRVIANFDAKVRHQKDDYRILISTEVLSEGVNLHRSNVVVNYDIPWNPTRMMQRVGRINRVDTPFDRIYTFNFFPTKQSNDLIKLREAAEAKINAFLTLLGGDAALLTEGEPVGSHELFNRLLNVTAITGEDEAEESELKYLNLIKQIREEDPALFEKVKRLPKKARAARKNAAHQNSLLTYFRRGKLQKFYLAAPGGESRELDFLEAARLMETMPDEKLEKIPPDYYDLLGRNKEAFIFATTEELTEQAPRRGRDSGMQIMRILKAALKDSSKLTDGQEEYLQKVLARLAEGALPKQTAREALKALEDLGNSLVNPLKVLAVLKTAIPPRLLEGHYVEQGEIRAGKREVILSEYFGGG
ncbi:MAG: helicase [Firmicutes bacterium]|nr:helicase [Bacillota bacterium]